MSDQFQSEGFDARIADISRQPPSLPSWLAARLSPNEEITWVRGPRFNPSWERYITHPALFVFALGLGIIGGGAGWLIAGPEAEVLVLLAVLAGGIVLASIFVLGISNGYFTRIVATNSRLLILQGYEVCRSWSVDDLPRRLVRYHQLGGEEKSPAIDLEAVKSMLGGSSDKFADSKSILAFSKQLEQIKSREKGR
ncbi:MAG TPA: hypothetical protein VN688_12050 [Gemmataceae bacterium]|nr:hypothetical protein [Gemmataceae bacterium]